MLIFFRDPHKFFCAIVLFLVGSPVVQAAIHTNDSIQLQVEGKIIAAPCKVNTPTIIALGAYAGKDLSVLGANSTTKMFQIVMTECPAGATSATITFTGAPYNDPVFSSAIYANDVADGAGGIGLQLYNLDGKSLVNLANGISYSVDIDSTTASAVLPVAARMYSPYGKVTSGDFSTVVSLNFTYQ